MQGIEQTDHTTQAQTPKRPHEVKRRDPARKQAQAPDITHDQSGAAVLTKLALLATFGAPVVALAKICGTYFGLSEAEANRKAARGELPVAAFRLADSQKSPYLVAVADLADHIDSTAEKARASWQRVQVD